MTAAMLLAVALSQRLQSLVPAGSGLLAKGDGVPEIISTAFVGCNECGDCAPGVAILHWNGRPRQFTTGCHDIAITGGTAKHKAWLFLEERDAP